MKETELKAELEAQGLYVSEDEFEYHLAHARRKCEITGKDESYLKILLPCVIREHIFRTAVNAISVARM